MVTAPRRMQSAPTARDALAAPPFLENGDRLPAAEFLRRFQAMPEVKKAELINGVVHMPSPVRTPHHAEPDNTIQGWLFYYRLHTPGTLSATNPTVRFDADNVPQPDGVLMIRRECGGNAHLDKEGYIHGAPELVVEVAASSAGIDLHDKMDAYRRAGVLEYLVWRTADKVVDWFMLENDEYVPNPPGAEGVISSRVFPGLILDVPALLRDDAPAVIARFSKTLNKAAHKSFVRRLGFQKSS